MNIILIFGLSGSGKTTLADKLALNIGAMRLNADEVRNHVNTDLDFSDEGRLEQAYRMGMLANRMALTNNVVVDFICPTKETRQAFADGAQREWNKVFTVWMNTVTCSEYPDTDYLFKKPELCDLIVWEKDTNKHAFEIQDMLSKF